jgi:hypothetical protein
MLAALLGSSLLYLVEYLPVLVSAQEAFQGVRQSLQETSAVVDAPEAARCSACWCASTILGAVA